MAAMFLALCFAPNAAHEPQRQDLQLNWVLLPLNGLPTTLHFPSILSRTTSQAAASARFGVKLEENRSYGITCEIDDFEWLGRFWIRAYSLAELDRLEGKMNYERRTEARTRRA